MMITVLITITLWKDQINDNSCDNNRDYDDDNYSDNDDDDNYSDNDNDDDDVDYYYHYKMIIELFVEH